MLQVLQKGVYSNLKFDGRSSTGNRYYTGLMRMEFAGFHGDEKKIYILEPSKQFTSLYRHDPTYIILNSIPIGQASIEIKKAVIQHIAYFEVGIQMTIPIILEPLPGGKANYGETKHKIRLHPRTRKVIRVEGVEKITIHPYSYNMERSQYYDIYLNLAHEKHHAENTNHFIGKTVDLNGEIEERTKIYSEYHAYKAVSEHHYFKYASADYQSHVYDQFDIYERQFSLRR
ncbi:MAG: hypothetical protein LBV74_21570 [Tannerella sp.]|jgi:hypothetical protein|nr:hypothetical protein [Tannerella sp.]